MNDNPSRWRKALGWVFSAVPLATIPLLTEALKLIREVLQMLG